MNQRGISRLLRFAACVPALLLLLSSRQVRAQGVGNGALLLRLLPGKSISHIAQVYGLRVLDGISDRNLYEVSVLNQNAFYWVELFLNFDPHVMYCEQEASISSPEFQASPFHIAFDISADASAFIKQVAYDLIDLGIVGTIAGNSSTVSPSAAPATVAVLDTGVDPTNTALSGRLLPGFNMIYPGQAPLDIPDGQNNTVVGHGTMISGIVARTSPNSNIMPVRVLNADGTGTLMHVLEGLHYAVLNGANVINMSFETNQNSIALIDGLAEASNSGIVLVASSGNDGTSAPRYPAAYPNVIGVASVENVETLSLFSNFGVNTMLLAPGSAIRSTFLNGSFANWSGTSFAAPFAAAEAAEIVARNPGWTPAQVTNVMLVTANSVDYLNPGFSNLLGAGIIDVQAAINWQGP